MKEKLVNETIGRFQLESVLGEGGMGTVYLAYDPANVERVALKLLSGAAATGDKLAQRFERECLALSKLNHPNLVEIYESGEANGRLYYTMEAIDGQSVDELIYTKGPLSPEKAVTVCRDLADGLAAVHAAGLLHRDIKPANVLIDKNNRAVLTDFGLVKVKGMSNLTQTNVFVGTYQYAAPEVLSGLPPRPRSDIYQLGLLCYILLTGDLLPFGQSLQEIARKLMVERLTPPSVLRDGIAAKLDSCVMKAVSRDPEERYETAEEFRDALDSALLETATTTSIVIKPALHRPRSTKQHERTDNSDWASHLPYLSPTAIHLILLLSLTYFAFAVTFRFRVSHRPTIPVKVALSWISSDWEALSFRLRTLKDKKSVHRVIKRMQRTDDLANELNDKLPLLLQRNLVDSKLWTHYLLKAEHPLSFSAYCNQQGIGYESPAEKTLSTMLTHMASYLSKMNKKDAVATVSRWQEKLLNEPTFDRGVDKVLKAAGLPSAGALLVAANTILRCQGKLIEGQERRRNLETLSFAAGDSGQHEKLALIFSPLTGGASPRDWAKGQLRKGS